MIRRGRGSRAGGRGEEGGRARPHHQIAAAQWPGRLSSRLPAWGGYRRGAATRWGWQCANGGRDGARGWIGPSADARPTPSSRWLLRAHGADIVTTANDPRLALALAEAGLGRLVLPCFAGDASPLDRLSDPIAELAHDEWLVSHHEARHAPPIRAALDALAEYLTGRLVP